MKQKEIIVYTCGDSNNISTWSNVPFLFTRTLEKKGYIIHRVDISPSPKINRWFNRFSYFFCKRILKLKACPEFHRTWLHRFLTYRRIKKATLRFPNIDFNLFLSFAFLNPYSDKPNILWCDWTDEISIERMHRKVQWYEYRSICHERKVMKNADIVYSMFPICTKQMEKMYHRPIHYLSRNVVNTIYSGTFDLNSNITHRKQSNIILFIGNIRYWGAAKDLLTAFESLQKRQDNLEYHIIGMTEEQMGSETSRNVFCHGYLHKDIPAESNLYYNLLLNAKILVNPAKEWGGYSSSIEAMFYGCPIVVSPYKDFVEEFGNNINFGKYINNSETLEQTISDIIDSPSYEDFCINAYNRVKDYTWDNYVSEFLTSLNTLLLRKSE